MNSATGPDKASPNFAQIIERIAQSSRNSASMHLEDASTPDLPLLSYENSLRRHAATAPLHETPDATPPPLTSESRRALTRELLAFTRQSRESEMKRCSVSVRLSQDESDILRLRAAESGMTISAYLRSCVLEADTLRTQVKQALLELRSRPTLSPQHVAPATFITIPDSPTLCPPEHPSGTPRCGTGCPTQPASPSLPRLLAGLFARNSPLRQPAP